jgi:hypothetical protein
VTDNSITILYLLYLTGTAIDAEALEQLQRMNIVNRNTSPETGDRKYRVDEIFIGVMFIPAISVT